MTYPNLRDGDRYLLHHTGSKWSYAGETPGDEEVVVSGNGTRLESVGKRSDWWDPFASDGYELELTPLDTSDPVNPSHYVFPSGVKTIQISEWLSANGAQAMQYIVRATRMDGKTKGGTQQQVEDLEKAIWFCSREVGRIIGLQSEERADD